MIPCVGSQGKGRTRVDMFASDATAPLYLCVSRYPVCGVVVVLVRCSSCAGVTAGSVPCNSGEQKRKVERSCKPDSWKSQNFKEWWLGWQSVKRAQGFCPP